MDSPEATPERAPGSRNPPWGKAVIRTRLLEHRLVRSPPKAVSSAARREIPVDTRGVRGSRLSVVGRSYSYPRGGSRGPPNTRSSIDTGVGIAVRDAGARRPGA